MKNLWVNTDYSHATWRVDLTNARERPDTLLDLVRAMLRAGTVHHVFEVVEANVISYRRDRDGDLDKVLADIYRRDGIVDLFGFTGAAMLPKGGVRSSWVETVLCYFNRDDMLVEAPISDQGALLKSLEPVSNSISRSHTIHYPPVRIVGRGYSPTTDSRHFPLGITIELHSDIWFPWVYGFAHPKNDLTRMFDNRELATCHTPRLNAFLEEVADVTLRVGGMFELVRDETATPALMWTDDTAIHLDRPPPDGVMPPEMLDVEWPPEL